MKIKIFLLVIFFIIFNFFSLKNFFEIFYIENFGEKNNKQALKLEKKDFIEARLLAAKIYLENKKNLKALEILQKIEAKTDKQKYFLYLLKAELYYRLSQEKKSNLEKQIEFLQNSLEFYRKALKQKYFLFIEKNILFIEEKLKKLKDKQKKSQKNQKQDKQNQKQNGDNKQKQDDLTQKLKNQKRKEFLKKYLKDLEKNQINFKKFYNKNYIEKPKTIEDFFDEKQENNKKDW